MKHFIVLQTFSNSENTAAFLALGGVRGFGGVVSTQTDSYCHVGPVPRWVATRKTGGSCCARSRPVFYALRERNRRGRARKQ